MKTIQINREVISSLYGDSSDNMQEVFAEFLNTYSELKQNLFSAFDSGNLNSVRRLLHFHGPSFMYLGIPEVAEMCKKLELKCAQADNHFLLAADFTLLIKAIEESWSTVVNEMECYQKAV